MTTEAKETSSFFVCIIYNGNDAQLTLTLNSVLRQTQAGLSVIVSVLYPWVKMPVINSSDGIALVPFQSNKDFFTKFVDEVSNTRAAYCTVIMEGDEVFDNAFDSVGRIFTKYDEINWLTGIQACRAEGGFNVSLGSTAIRRWSFGIYERNLYKNSGRYIPPASTFWRKSIWASVLQQLYFIRQNDFCEDLWATLFKTQKLYTCKVYLSASGDYDKLNKAGYKRPNYNALIEDGLWNRMKEFFFINNIPYLRLLYRRESRLAPVIRFDLNSQSYFLSSY